MKSNSNFKKKFYVSSEVLTLELEGSLDIYAKNELAHLYQELERENFLHLILNLANVRKIDTVAHRLLVQLQLLARKRPIGRVRIIPPPSPLKDKLMHEGILKREEIYNDLKSALESI